MALVYTSSQDNKQLVSNIIKSITMKNNINNSEVNKLTKNIDKQLMQLLMSDLKKFRSTVSKSKQAA